MSKADRKGLNSIWSDERTTALKRLWGAGKSASEIAREMDCFEHCQDGGRSAVIGKVYRLKLSPRDLSARCRSPRRCRPPRPSTVVYQPKTRRLPPPSPASPLPLPGVTDVARVSLLDLQPHHCRWPVGEPTRGFCGCPALVGLPYCEPHARRAYRPVETKRSSSPPPSKAPALGISAITSVAEFVDA